MPKNKVLGAKVDPVWIIIIMIIIIVIIIIN